MFALEHNWSFVVHLADGSQREYLIPAGYQFDGASVPAILQRIFGASGYSAFGLHIAAALEHDFLCEIGAGGSVWLRRQFSGSLPAKISSRDTHAHFARRLREDGVRPGQAAVMAAAVKWFGPRWKL